MSKPVIQIGTAEAREGGTYTLPGKPTAEHRKFCREHEGKHFMSLKVEIPKGYHLRKPGESLEGKAVRVLQQPACSHSIQPDLSWTDDLRYPLDFYGTLSANWSLVIVKEETEKDRLLQKIDELKQQVKELDCE